MRKTAVLFVVACSLCVPASASAAPGDIDRTFGDNGFVLNTDMEIDDMVRRPEGILVSGRYGELGEIYSVFRPAVARYTNSGALDPSFGEEGVSVMPAAWGDETATIIAVQPDGKLLLKIGLGHRLARLNADGSIDRTFGTGGVTDVLPSYYYLGGGIAVAGDGSIYATGATDLRRGGLLLVKYTPDGVLDTSFRGDGIRLLQATEEGPYGVAEATDGPVFIRPRGRILVVGGQGATTAVLFKPNGSLDASFGGGDGVTFVHDGPFHVVFPVAVVDRVGRIWIPGADTQGLTIRLRADGSLDRTFGDDGFVRTPFTGRDAALLPDGRVAFVGQVERPRAVALAVLDDEGLDTSFGGGDGIQHTDIEQFFGRETPFHGTEIAAQSNGKVLISAMTMDDTLPYGSILLRLSM